MADAQTSSQMAEGLGRPVPRGVRDARACPELNGFLLRASAGFPPIPDGLRVKEQRASAGPPRMPGGLRKTGTMPGAQAKWKSRPKQARPGGPPTRVWRHHRVGIAAALHGGGRNMAGVLDGVFKKGPREAIKWARRNGGQASSEARRRAEAAGQGSAQRRAAAPSPSPRWNDIRDTSWKGGGKKGGGKGGKKGSNKGGKGGKDGKSGKVAKDGHIKKGGKGGKDGKSGKDGHIATWQADSGASAGDQSSPASGASAGAQSSRDGPSGDGRGQFPDTEHDEVDFEDCVVDMVACL